MSARRSLTVNPWRVWLLVAVACWAAVAPAFATAFVSGFNVRGPENRVWNFFPPSVETRQENRSQVADSHLEKVGHGYEVVSGVHVYLYAQDDPVMGRDPSGHFSLVEVMAVADDIGILAKIAVVSYLALTVTNPWREWTLYSSFTSDSPVGFHAYMYAKSQMNQTIRYDIGVNDVQGVLNNVFGFHIGYISGQYVSSGDVGFGVPVAKLSNRGKAVWEKLVVGRPVVCDPITVPFTYNIPIWNCATWTGTATLLAITVSLIPF